MMRKRVYAPYGPRKRFRSEVKSPVAGFRMLNQRYSRGPSRSGTLTDQVKSIQRVMAKNSPEVKYFDSNVDATNIPTTGTVVPITAMAQGDTAITRTGNSIIVNTLRFGGFWSRTATDPSAVSFSRIAIVVDKQSISDTDPSAAQIFESPNEPVQAFPFIGSLDRFKIIYMSQVFDSNMMVLDSDQVLTHPPTQKSWVEISWKGSVRVGYNGAATTDGQKNQMYVVFLSNGTTVDFDGSCRVGFSDA